MAWDKRPKIFQLIRPTRKQVAANLAAQAPLDAPVCDHEWSRGVRQTLAEPMVSQCKKCGLERVVRRKLSDDPLTALGDEKLERGDD